MRMHCQLARLGIGPCFRPSCLDKPLFGVEIDNPIDRDNPYLEDVRPFGEEILSVISPERVTVLTGEFGSGKSEITLNFALMLARAGIPVSMIDLDIMKPLFRSRDAAKEIAHSGVEMIVPKGSLAQFEMPAVNPRVHAVLGSRRRRVMVDVTGADAGGTVIKGFKYLFGEKEEGCLLFVVNPYRPFSETPERIASGAELVARSSGIRPRSFVSNPNYGARTTEGDVLAGHETVERACELYGAPIQCLTVSKDLGADTIERIRKGAALPVVPIRRMLRPPWGESEEQESV